MGNGRGRGKLATKIVVQLENTARGVEVESGCQGARHSKAYEPWKVR